MQEEIIVSMTTWKPRMHNIPVVLDTIYAQTVRPDKVVVNLAYDEVIPEDVLSYINEHQIEVNYVPNTKVYKKFLPTLLKYPEACVINIDDDCIFPQNMIEDFMVMHKKYPKFPISGNKVYLYGMQCHCGCASLTKYEYFGEYLHYIDDDLMNNCSSSDIVFTYFATKNRHPYICTKDLYFYNLVQNDLENNPYSDTIVANTDGINTSYNYLVNRFGEVRNVMNLYINDECIANLVQNQLTYIDQSIDERIHAELYKQERQIRSSSAYRLGVFLLKPIKMIKKLLKL